MKCFGKADGIPISPVNSLLADGKGGFWLGGQTALVHWHDGVSETYPIEALKSNVGQPGIVGLARGPDGSLWVGIFRSRARARAWTIDKRCLPTICDAQLRRQQTRGPHHDLRSRRQSLGRHIMARGFFVSMETWWTTYGRTEGLSSDSVNAVFEDREGILWAATPDGIDKFRDPPVTSFSTLGGIGEGLPRRRSGQQRWHNLGRKPWLSRSHREERDRLLHSHPGWSSG